MSVNKDALETTNLGVVDRTYVPGLRGATGSAEVMYDPTDKQALQLLNSIFSDDESVGSSVTFTLDRTGGVGLACSAFVTSVSPSVNVGDIQVCSVSFQVSGPITGGF